MRVDYGMEIIQWRIVVIPIVALLSVSSATLIYIVYGHQVGYFRLSEAQLTAGILYSMAALLCVIVVVAVGQFLPVEGADWEWTLDTQLFLVGLGPIVVLLVGAGAWNVSRDEFDRLLRFGGQAAVHPMKLKLEKEGWTALVGSGITVIPMFGEVSFEPLDDSKSLCIELCPCCSCYPHEEKEDVAVTVILPSRSIGAP